MTKPAHYIFALAEDFTHLAFACAVEPLRIANLVSRRELYRWSYASANGETATASNGTVSLVHHGFAIFRLRPAVRPVGGEYREARADP
jgi:transcriptional regulator GlxA family with amidase domain